MSFHVWLWCESLLSKFAQIKFEGATCTNIWLDWIPYKSACGNLACVCVCLFEACTYFRSARKMIDCGIFFGWWMGACFGCRLILLALSHFHLVLIWVRVFDMTEVYCYNNSYQSRTVRWRIYFQRYLRHALSKNILAW